MKATFTQPPQSQVLYPDDDGQPMSENTLQFKWIVLIKENLESLFRQDPNVFVAGDLLWYAEEGQPKIRQAPDVMVVCGRPKGERGSYKQWEEAGMPPHVVFEILSPGNRPDEMTRKLRFYEKYGVEEYYVYNPEDGLLLGFRRGPAGLQEIVPMRGHVSPRLQIRFEPGAGSDNLRILHPDGQPFLSHQQLVDNALAERLRAEAERARADRLAARLRELGVEPDGA